ncbi:hypothetical protein ACGFX2_37970 [Streptomyces goshikiensis]
MQETARHYVAFWRALDEELGVSPSDPFVSLLQLGAKAATRLSPS